MLILSRKPAESIVIGDNIFVTVLGCSGQLVRLGITAPSGITIHREEIFNKIKAQIKAQTKDQIKTQKDISNQTNNSS